MLHLNDLVSGSCLDHIIFSEKEEKAWMTKEASGHTKENGTQLSHDETSVKDADC
jgi:hypothetical protein